MAQASVPKSIGKPWILLHIFLAPLASPECQMGATSKRNVRRSIKQCFCSSPNVSPALDYRMVHPTKTVNEAAS